MLWMIPVGGALLGAYGSYEKNKTDEKNYQRDMKHNSDSARMKYIMDFGQKEATPAGNLFNEMTRGALSGAAQGAMLVNAYAKDGALLGKKEAPVADAVNASTPPPPGTGTGHYESGVNPYATPADAAFAPTATSFMNTVPGESQKAMTALEQQMKIQEAASPNAFISTPTSQVNAARNTGPYIGAPVGPGAYVPPQNIYDQTRRRGY